MIIACNIAVFVSVSIVGATPTLAPDLLLQTGASASQAVLSLDGKTLIAVIKDGDRQDLVAWDVPRRSKTVLVKQADFVLINPCANSQSWLSPDGKSLLGFFGTLHAGAFEATAFIVNIADRTKTDLCARTGTLLLSLNGEFSLDGTRLAIPDTIGNLISLWSRNAAGKWIDPATLGLAHDGAVAYRQIATAFGPDGKELFVCVFTGEERGQWDIEKWDVVARRQLEFHARPIPSELWLAHVAVSGREHKLCLHIVEGGYGIDTLTASAHHAVPSGSGYLFLSPDGRTASVVKSLLMHADAPGSAPTTEVYLWKVADRTAQKTFTARGRGTPWGSFSQDSRYFVFAPSDHLVQVVDVAKGSVASTFLVASCIIWITMLNTGEIAIIGTERKTITVSKFNLR
jgi:hypothetical protein